MQLDDIRKKLEASDEGKETFEAILDLINAEKEKGIFESSKRNKEAQSLRKYKQILEETGYDISDEENLKDSLSRKSHNKNSDDALTLKSLQARLDKAEKERDAERLNSKRKTIQAELTNAIGDKVYGAKFLISSLISDGSVDIVNDEVVFKHGDELLSFQDGVKRTLEENKEMLKTTQSGGSKTNQSRTDKNIEAILASKDPSLINSNLSEIAKATGLVI
jgi:hypothetical protein